MDAGVEKLRVGMKVGAAAFSLLTEAVWRTSLPSLDDFVMPLLSATAEVRCFGLTSSLPTEVTLSKLCTSLALELPDSEPGEDEPLLSSLMCFSTGREVETAKGRTGSPRALIDGGLAGYCSPGWESTKVGPEGEVRSFLFSERMPE